MVLKSDKIRLRKMLSDSITVLCRAGLPFQSKVQVEALIGITLDDSEVILLSFKETMSSNGLILSSDSADEDDTNDRRNFVIDEDQNCNSASVTVKAEYANVEWDATDNYKTTNRSRHSVSAQKFRDFDASGEGVKGNFSGEQDELFPSTSTEMGRQPGDDGYDRFDGSLVNDNQLGRNFSDEGHRGFRAQMKVEVNDELDNNTDDCMITKSEVLTSGECYEIDEDQTWAGQDDVFDGNNFHDLQGGEVPCDTMPTAYDEDPNWLPQLSKPPPAKKFKMPLQQKRQTWTARPSSTFTKSRNFQPAAKLHSKPTPRPIKNEVCVVCLIICCM